MQRINAEEVIEALGLEHFRGLSTFGALPDEVVVDMLQRGEVWRQCQGEHISRVDQIADSFQIILQGRLAYYKHGERYDVLTRHFCAGEQVGFDLMQGLIRHDGTDVALEDTMFLVVSASQFHDLHVNFPSAFGLLMINLARELAREIEMLEDVIASSTGWLLQDLR